MNNNNNNDGVETIAVEGNIGAGKTTFIEMLADNPHCTLVPEPVDKWTNLHGLNPLEELYSRPDAAMAVNTYMALTRREMHVIETHGRPVRVIERSLHAMRHVFVEYAYGKGEMNELDYRVMDELYTMLATDLPSIDMIVYLATPPELCLERLRKRGRKEEQGLTLTFLEHLDTLYWRWIKSLPAVPVRVIVPDRQLLDELESPKGVALSTTAKWHAREVVVKV